MTFEPKYVENNVNVSHRSHGREFAKLAVILTAIVLTVYFALGFIAEMIVTRLPPSAEEILGKSLTGNIKDDTLPQTRAYAQNILDRLARNADTLPPFTYRIDIMEEDTVNAIALPAGRIILFTGLLEKITSENQLAMVLGHELGHYANRDHLRGFGRSIVLLAIATFFSASGQTSTFLMPSIETLDMRFSRGQEQKADLFGLDLVVKTYGHAGGILDVYGILEQNNHFKFLPAVFSTHPDILKRKQFLEQNILEKQYSSESPVLLPDPGRLPLDPENQDTGDSHSATSTQTSTPQTPETPSTQGEKL